MEGSGKLCFGGKPYWGCISARARISAHGDEQFVQRTTATTGLHRTSGPAGPGRHHVRRRPQTPAYSLLDQMTSGVTEPAVFAAETETSSMMSTQLSLPRSPADVTASWLSEVLDTGVADVNVEA